MSGTNNSTLTIPHNQWIDSIDLVSSTTVASTAYGIMLTLYFICCYFLTLQLGQKRERRRSIFLICYITVMFALGTTYVATTTQATMVSYVYFANFPGGPSNYTNLVLFSGPVGILNTVSYVVINWMADAMLLWRLFVLFQGLGNVYAITAVSLPALIYMGSLATRFLFIIQTPNGEISFAMPYFVLSVSMTVIATGLMLWRILSITKLLRNALGKQATNTYSHVCAILAESCALYAIFSILFIVLFGISHPLQYVFLSALANVQIIAPLLIIFRVLQGKAWNRAMTDSTQISIKFKTGQADVISSQEKVYNISLCEVPDQYPVEPHQTKRHVHTSVL